MSQTLAKPLDKKQVSVDNLRMKRRDSMRNLLARIPVWVLEQARRLGLPESEILRCYPTLRAEDLANAWAYVRAHPSEIDSQIRENEDAE